MKLKGSKGDDKYLTYDSGLDLRQPILHRIGLGRRSASNHGQSQFYEGEAVGEILASLINGGEQIIVVDLSPWIAGELAASY